MLVPQGLAKHNGEIKGTGALGYLAKRNAQSVDRRRAGAPFLALIGIAEQPR
jgi:hypothetical protein